MKLNDELQNWLDKSNGLQCKWLLQKLTGKQRLKIDPKNYEDCINLLKHGSHHLEEGITFSYLKSVWSSYKSKYSSGKKSFNFVMDIVVEEELENLVKKLKASQNRVVELLIRKQYNKELKAQLKREDSERQNRANIEHILAPLGYKNKLDELKKLKLDNEKLKLDNDKLLRTQCELVVLLDNKKITKTSLSDSDKEKAEEMYEIINNQ